MTLKVNFFKAFRNFKYDNIQNLIDKSKDVKITYYRFEINLDSILN